MRQTLRLSLCVVALGIVSPSAEAATLLKTVYTGTVDAISGSEPASIFPGIKLGDTWTAAYYFDLTNAPLAVTPTYTEEFGGTSYGSLSPVVLATLTIDGTVYHQNSAFFGEAFVGNAPYSQFNSIASDNIEYFYSTITNPNSGAWSATFVPGTYLNADSPASLNYLELANGRISATVSEVSISDVSAIPEPATWALFILGFGGIGASLRRERSRGVALA